MTAPTHERQKIIPYLYYHDGVRAMQYLADVFGFEERVRVVRDDGSLMHGELGYDGNVVMLGSPISSQADGSDPSDARNHVPTGSVMCYVDDVDAHYATARASGATVAVELENKPYGERMYAARDFEGHQWFFSTPL